MTTLTQLTKDLGIGKGTLYKTLSDLGITPHQQGRKRVLDDDQVQRIQSAIVSGSGPRPSETVNRQTRDAKTDDGNIVNVLQGQIEHLKKLLDSEKEEKSQLLGRLGQEQESSERIQQLLSVTMAETSRLRSENQQLRLEFQSPAHNTAGAEKRFEDAEARVTTEGSKTIEPLVARSSQANRWGWSALAVAVIGIVGWVITRQDPDIQIRVAEFMRW